MDSDRKDLTITNPFTDAVVCIVVRGQCVLCSVQMTEKRGKKKRKKKKRTDKERKRNRKDIKRENKKKEKNNSYNDLQ